MFAAKGFLRHFRELSFCGIECENNKFAAPRLCFVAFCVQQLMAAESRSALSEGMRRRKHDFITISEHFPSRWSRAHFPNAAAYI